MRDIRDKLTGLIAGAVENGTGRELVTAAGNPTPRGGYPTTLMYAQRGTATTLTIRVAWYPGSAGFDLSGPAVNLVPEEGRAELRIALNAGQLAIHSFVGHSDGPGIDALIALISELLERAG